jgi:hypothetical protein
MLNEFETQKPIFGDQKWIEENKRRRKHEIEKMKITIDYKLLLKAGVEKNQAIDLLKRLLEAKKK